MHTARHGLILHHALSIPFDLVCRHVDTIACYALLWHFAYLSDTWTCARKYLCRCIYAYMHTHIQVCKHILICGYVDMYVCMCVWCICVCSYDSWGEACATASEIGCAAVSQGRLSAPSIEKLLDYLTTLPQTSWPLQEPWGRLDLCPQPLGPNSTRLIAVY